MPPGTSYYASGERLRPVRVFLAMMLLSYFAPPRAAMPLPPSPDLPDYRNLGVLLRALLLLGLFLLGGLLLDEGGEPLPWRLLRLSSLLVPGALLSLGLLALLGRRLHHGRRAALAAAAICLLSFAFCGRLLNPLAPMPWGQVLLAGAVGGLMQHYLNLRARALSPALSEARLIALQARIRPHFLFNSLNAAIALIGKQPDKAEMVLENLADLFRAQLGDPARQSTLGREIELAAMYLAIEAERLGARLQVSWDVQAPLDAALPPLILQPLAENAVFHGIERLADGGEIRIQARQHEKLLELTLSNPVNLEPAAATPGHHMALDNLAERLELYFDAEASLSARLDGDRFITHIRLPYRPAPTQQPG